MLPASNRGAGTNIGFPDVCLTPAAPAPIPVPYPNIGMNAQALGFSPVVKISGVNALNLGSTISMTSGDEAGSAHPTIKGMGRYTMGSPIVSIDKLPGITLTCPTTGNMNNNAAGIVAVPSAVNVMFCCATPTTTEGSALAHLAEEMTSSRLTAELLPGDVAYVRLPCFAHGVATDLFRALAGLGAVATALVVDLRGNPGGDLHAAVHLAAEFIESGTARVELLQSDGERAVVESAAKGHYAQQRLVLIVDGQTASAAEVFASLLRARATLVGERTFGKRTVAIHSANAVGSNPREIATWIVGTTAGPLAPDMEVGTRDDICLKTAWAHALE